jgi:hypothetical protein
MNRCKMISYFNVDPSDGDVPLTYQQAETKCEALNGTLLKGNDYITDMIKVKFDKTLSATWIGGQYDGGFFWIGGEAVNILSM